MMMMTMVFVTVFVGYQNTLLTSCSMYCTQCCSASRHWHTQFRPRLVILAAWEVVLARHPRKYPVQAGNHKASLSAVQGSWVPGRVVDCSTPESDIPSRRHLRQLLDITWPYIPRYQLSTFGRRAFSVAGPTVWNSLPDSLRDPALRNNSFKQLLKTNLFQRCHSARTAQ